MVGILPGIIITANDDWFDNVEPSYCFPGAAIIVGGVAALVSIPFFYQFP